MSKKRTLESWVREGIDQGFCTEVYCDTHDAYAQEDAEVLSELFELSGGDHCMPVVRIKSDSLEDQLQHYKESE